MRPELVSANESSERSEGAGSKGSESFESQELGTIEISNSNDSDPFDPDATPQRSVVTSARGKRTWSAETGFLTMCARWRCRNGANAYCVAINQTLPVAKPPSTSVGQWTPRYSREYRATTANIAPAVNGQRHPRSR